ncbi:TPA: hypothetical protein N0F65_001648 [Lagenidium giganteum]|uniref:Uncharacterized protein n=1 Tax=Lagenidium giganteum TaxID=4803 RepID=A0AAV2Z1J9_9STRA|nr:TPA: hypothetical protein N0F65_001648 [Lagenidium giganteum]
MGHRVSTAGIEVNPKKVNEIPLTFLTSLKGIQSFTGSFAMYGAALYEVSEEDFHKRDPADPWWNAAHKSFEKLKEAVGHTPVLRHFDPAAPVVISVTNSFYATE